MPSVHCPRGAVAWGMASEPGTLASPAPSDPGDHGQRFGAGALGRRLGVDLASAAAWQRGKPGAQASPACPGLALLAAVMQPHRARAKGNPGIACCALAKRLRRQRFGGRPGACWGMVAARLTCRLGVPAS